MEPTTTGAGVAAGMKAATGWKAMSGTAGAAGALGIGAALAAFVVMAAKRPRTGSEWAIGLISTVVASIAGGAYAILKLGLLAELKIGADDLQIFVTLCAGLGLAFSCGLPGWMIVRWWFNYAEKRRRSDLAEIAAELKKDFAP